MHSLSVVFGPTGTVLQFLFKERADADKQIAAWKQGADDFVVIADDYKQHAEIRRSTIHGLSVEDLAESGDAVIARSLQNAKTQVKGNRAAQNDPILKLAQGNGVAMNHPGAPQGFARRSS